MHEIEPYYNWRSIYIASEDQNSPFYGRQYSEFEFSNAIYDYFIHPQWDKFDSNTLYLKILYVNYDLHYCVIELLGEWNDALYNDIMHLYRNVIETLLENDIIHFILIGETVPMKIGASKKLTWLTARMSGPCLGTCVNCASSTRQRRRVKRLIDDVTTRYASVIRDPPVTGRSSLSGSATVPSLAVAPRYTASPRRRGRVVPPRRR